MHIYIYIYIYIDIYIYIIYIIYIPVCAKNSGYNTMLCCLCLPSSFFCFVNVSKDDF